MSEKLKFIHLENQQYVYFIRPKPHKNFQGSGCFLSVARCEDEAWSFVLKIIGDEYKHEYYIDDIFLSHNGQALGLMWGNEPTV